MVSTTMTSKMRATSDIYDQLEDLKEELEAQGQKCSAVKEIEPGIYELKVGVNK